MSKAGLLPSKNQLENIPKLISDFYLLKPIHNKPEHRVSFGTSGHRGKATQRSFNQNHM